MERERVKLTPVQRQSALILLGLLATASVGSCLVGVAIGWFIP